MLVVAKFGGSSLSCSTQFEKVKNIIKADPKRKIVVVSALGKRNSSDSKITDLLYILHAHIRYGVPYTDIWGMIESRFLEVRDDLKIDYPIEKDLNSLKAELNKNISEDYLVSRGEYLTAKLVAAYLGYEFADAKDIIRFNYDGKISEEETNKLGSEAFEKYGKIVVPGFYGAYANGNIKLLSRGGSDVSGSLLARAVNASLYENWTDVSGVLAVDPRIIKNPRPIREITYAELRELSYMGANVLHEETIFPIQALKIPINIRNTNEPENVGTMIKQDCEDKEQAITGIAGKKDFVSITLFKDHMSNEVGILRKTLSVFERYGCSIEHVPSGIDSFSVVLSENQIEKCEFELVADLKKELGVEASVEHNLAMIAVVGRNMAGRSGICASLFSVLGEKNINVKMIAQGTTELNIVVGVEAKDYENAVRAIYEKLVK